MQRLSGPVAFESLAESLDATDGFVPHDDGQRDGQLAFPQMHIGAADAGHLGAHEHGAGFELFRHGKLAEFERRMERGEDGGSGGGHRAGVPLSLAVPRRIGSVFPFEAQDGLPRRARFAAQGRMPPPPAAASSTNRVILASFIRHDHRVV